MPVAPHGPYCQCSQCKPKLGPAARPEGDNFRIFIEVSFPINARDYYSATQQAAVLANAIVAELSGAVVAECKVLGVERI